MQETSQRDGEQARRVTWGKRQYQEGSYLLSKEFWVPTYGRQWALLWPAQGRCARLPWSHLVSPGCDDYPASPWRGFGSFSLSGRQGSLRTESRRNWKMNARGEILRKTETQFKWPWSQNKTRVLALLSSTLASLSPALALLLGSLSSCGIDCSSSRLTSYQLSKSRGTGAAFL